MRRRAAPLAWHSSDPSRFVGGCGSVRGMTKRPRWKLHVEGLGKIREADVEIHPLMLFVGDNDSGKSQMASLLWGLFALQGELAPFSGPSLPECEARLHEMIYGPDRAYRLTEEDQDRFTDLFNETLAQKKNAFVGRVFNDPSVTIGKIDLRHVNRSSDQKVFSSLDALREAQMADPDGDGVAFFGSDEGQAHPELRSHEVTTLVEYATLRELWSSPGGFDGSYRARSPIYLPSARSGFILLYKSVARRQTTSGFLRTQRAAELPPDLTSPVIQFLDLLAFGMESGAGPYGEEADFLEKELRGTIQLVTNAGAVNKYLYHPSGAAFPLTMALSSSLVTELAPVVSVLRHMSDFRVLVLEEPEAHLHPRLQRKLAQVIVRLIRKGVYVWITTHSENFCQQINNFMKIGAVEDRAQLRADLQMKLGYSYGEQDYLTPDDVVGYEFINEGDHSVVRELKKYEDGMVMPSFNKEMVALTREVLFLDEKMGEKE